MAIQAAALKLEKKSKDGTRYDIADILTDTHSDGLHAIQARQRDSHVGAQETTTAH